MVKCLIHCFQFETCHATDAVYCPSSAIYTACVHTIPGGCCKRYHLWLVYILWVSLLRGILLNPVSDLFYRRSV